MAQIGSYEILDELGRGAMGVVFRASDAVIGRTVALKVIRPRAFGTEEENQALRLRFTREAAAAGRLSHPNIVTVYHAGTAGDSQFLVMELVEGRPLDRAIVSGELGSPASCVPILRQVASALDYAHGQGIFHRDIKPGNVLLRPDGVVKLTDFGIAHISSETVTQTGVTMGTPAYMAPEQIRAQRIDGRADQFSMAVLAFEMFTGKKPFTGPSDHAAMFAIVSGERPLAHLMNSALRPEVSGVLQRGLAKEPADRFPTCGGFVAALEAASIPPVPPAETEMISPSGADRNPKKQVLVWAGVLLLAAAAAFGVWRFQTLRTSARQDVKGQKQGQSEAAALEPRVKVNGKDGQRYVWISPGLFQMGCSPGDGQCHRDEEPAHQETIAKGFWMGQTKVTQAAYAAVMGDKPSHFKGDRLPVETVNWSEAQTYCGKVGMRLPTEAEWEYAGRGGEEKSRYGALDAVAWYGMNSRLTTQEVGQKAANRYGLYDMLGNVLEWAADWYDSSQEKRVVRGSWWFSVPWEVRVSYRDGAEPSFRGFSIGFRCAGELP